MEVGWWDLPHPPTVSRSYFFTYFHGSKQIIPWKKKNFHVKWMNNDVLKMNLLSSYGNKIDVKITSMEVSFTPMKVRTW